ncbi:radical SAM protein [Desulfobacula phenolica]|uniref:Radical SAM superfamily enzyme, MoaA/NifB/PqqE/SkfB family n=1 Tax=Desulfobacula phenolica TaxID=90732 RepID=A0A1H2K865_9BACT|nr:radical SAM protein [Desulfobacula phenolica]SDU64869.1 Radical SAM superfamily enzyme, MoaA/NifB/PqqE/SkfB family [Desulfobacula phenolica]
MIKLYRENLEFGEFSKFDTTIGELESISEKEFNILEKREPEIKVYDHGLSPNRTGFPRRIYFQITRKCNLSCDYCFIKASPDQHHLDKNVIFKIADYCGQKGLMEVRLTGGEPTLHPDFIEIYERFKKNNIYVSVATNGIWSREIRNFLINQENLWVIVSVDGSKATHNRYRNGSYDRIVENLEKLKTKNPCARIRINTVLTKSNKEDLENLAALAKTIGAESITLIPLRPQVRNPAIKNEMLTSREFKHIIERMVVYKKQYGVNFTTTMETDYKDDIMADKIFTKKSSCAAGREGTNLDFDYAKKKLVVYACSYCPASDPDADQLIRAPFIAGDFNFDDVEKFGDIWNNDDNWALFRDLSLKSEECRTCDELGSRCTGSCPIQNLDLDELNLKIDVKNQLKQQMRQNAEWYCFKKIFTRRDESGADWSVHV